MVCDSIAFDGILGIYFLKRFACEMDFQAGTMRIGKDILQLSTSSYSPPHPIHSIQGTKHPTDRKFIEIIPDSAAHQETVHKLRKLIRENAGVFAWPGEPPGHSRINRHKMYTDPVKGGLLKFVPDRFRCGGRTPKIPIHLPPVYNPRLSA